MCRRLRRPCHQQLCSVVAKKAVPPSMYRMAQKQTTCRTASSAGQMHHEAGCERSGSSVSQAAQRRQQVGCVGRCSCGHGPLKAAS